MAWSRATPRHQRVRKKNSSFLYNGTRTMYEREGFTYDRPKGLGNCVMVREVAANLRYDPAQCYNAAIRRTPGASI